ncbi:hypothetical protein [Saccharothrix obliqua]|uniref:hypothetical protein n=1 Tax=Saccharothrix obliqua TaxID=2861747 RepID=UPI001C606659|nr:hypothetical protein [Saccharothrix obliqua]MBW4719743.1 hypothetical protein [Saccharothrix obliqua]
MSIVSAIKPNSGSWIPLIAWALVIFGLAALVALLTTATAGLVTGGVLAVAALVVNALVKARRTMDRIFTEELD